MIPLLLALPIDWSGKSPHNRTKGEIHNLTPQAQMPYRIIVMEKGYFYTDDLFMIDSRGYVLTENDYQCIAINREVIDEVKKTACAVILITNPDVGNLVRVDAQMVGGKYCILNQAIIETAANVILATNRKLYWKDVTDKPDGYIPNGHLHALWELFGFTGQTNSLKRITTALDKKAAKDFDILFQEFLIDFGGLDDQLAIVDNRLTNHIADRNNPHQLTVSQIGLSNVYNGLIATQSDALYNYGQNRTSYATPFRCKQFIDTQFTPRLTQHINDLNNPHQETAAKLGTMTNLEFRLEANKYYNRGEATQLSYRIGGLDYYTYYAALRQSIPIGQILYGVFPQNSYVPVPQTTGYIMQPSSSGYLVWTPFQQAVQPYVKQGNDILYAGQLTLPYDNERNNQAPYMATASVNWLTSVLGVGHREGTIAVFQISRTWGIGTSNGSVATALITDAMAVIQGGRWAIPGYV